MDDKWDFLLSEFSRLGGVAENVCQKEGEYGRGIFSVNPSLKARIFTTSKLLVKKDDIYLEDNKLRIKKNKEYSQEIRNFLISIKITFLGDQAGEKRQSFSRKD